MSEPSIRTALSSDLNAVEGLERAIFSDPWTRANLAAELRDDPRRVALLAEGADGEAVGFAFAWCIADEIHLVNLGVLADWRRRGVAQKLLDAVMTHPAAARGRIVTLEVRASNRPALSFYERNGFIEVALRPRYYPDTGEDAVVMLKSLTAGESPAPPG